MKHTPLPWRLRLKWDDGPVNIIEGNVSFPPGKPEEWCGKWIALFPTLVPELREQQKVDAEFIVTACTHFEEAIELLRLYHRYTIVDVATDTAADALLKKVLP